MIANVLKGNDMDKIKNLIETLSTITDEEVMHIMSERFGYCTEMQLKAGKTAIDFICKEAKNLVPEFYKNNNWYPTRGKPVVIRHKTNKSYATVNFTKFEKGRVYTESGYWLQEGIILFRFYKDVNYSRDINTLKTEIQYLDPQEGEL